jgi:predicted nucleic-acid-binding protein
MIAIDTNIIIRYIINDDEEKCTLVANLFNKHKGIEQSIFINNIVFCEVIWVLMRGYKYNKEQIITTITLLLTSVEFAFENHSLLFLAVIEYKKNNADFSDILISMTNKGLKYNITYSFDKNACNANVFEELI